MLRVTQNKDEIIIREIPFVRWLGYLAAAFFLLIPVFFTYSTEGDFFDQLFQFAWICICGGTCLFFALTSPVTTIKINRPGQTVSVRKQSLIKYKFNVYSFNEIADLIFVELKDDSRGATVHQLIMPLKNGDKIELSTADGSKNSQYFDAAYLMNPYIFDTSKQIPFNLTILNDD